MSNVFVMETPADNGEGTVEYAYPRDVIVKFLQYIVRANRFIVSHDSEMMLDRVLKFRGELLNKREPMATTTTAGLVEGVPTPDVAPVGFDDMSDDELLAIAEQVEGALSKRQGAPS